MKTVLLAGDIESALNDIIEINRNNFREVFVEFGSNELNTIFLNNIDLTLDSLYEDVAECGSIREEIGGTYSYPVLFMKDENGVWKIRTF